jgi:Tfp pilus assembly protein PilN
MNRFNFLAPSPSDRLRAFPVLMAPASYRPIAMLGAMVVFVGAISGVEQVRLHLAQRDQAISTSRLERSDASIADVKHLESRVNAEADLLRAIRSIQQSGGRQANELAVIGNRLPPDAWLTAVHIENGKYALEGMAARVSAVATIMTTLRNAPTRAVPTLVSIVNDRDRKSTTLVQYSIRLETPAP